MLPQMRHIHRLAFEGESSGQSTHWEEDEEKGIDAEEREDVGRDERRVWE